VFHCHLSCTIWPAVKLMNWMAVVSIPRQSQCVHENGVEEGARYTEKNEFRPSCKMFNFKQNWILKTDFSKTVNKNCHANLSRWSLVISSRMTDGQTEADRQTYTHDKLMGAFRNSCQLA
jgi:hypothetical protein